MSPVAVLRAHFIDALREALPRPIRRWRRKLLCMAIRQARARDEGRGR